MRALIFLYNKWHLVYYYAINAKIFVCLCVAEEILWSLYINEYAYDTERIKKHFI